MPQTGNTTGTPIKIVDAVDPNQPPLGTGTNPMRVDPTGTTVQPVSIQGGGGGGTQYQDGAASGAHPTGNQVIGWNKGGTTELGVTARSLTNAQSLDVAIVDGSGNQITSFGGGTQYATGTAVPTPTGTAALGWDGTDVRIISTDSSGRQVVNQGTANTNANSWPVEVTDGTNVLGVSAHPFKIDPTGTTTQPISGTVSLTAGQAVELLDSGGTNKASISAAGAVKVDGSAVTQPVSGTITANQGTAAANTAGWPVTAGTLAEVTAAWNSSTGANATLQLNVAGYNSVAITFNQGSTITGGQASFEVSDTTAFTNAYSVQAVQANAFTAAAAYVFQQNANQAFEVDVAGFAAFRVRLSTVISGTGTINVGLAATMGATQPDVTVGGTVGISGTVTLAANQSVNVNQIGGSGLAAGPSGMLPIAVTPNTNSNVAFTSSTSSALSTAAVIKNAAGNLYGILALNGSSSTQWLEIINAASSPSLGTNVVLNIPLPPSTSQPIYINPGVSALVNCSTGISAGVATTVGGSTAGTASIVVFFYK